ncbi:hypothetical protein [Dubosiella newyorkensis]|uniref:Prepilin type IV endopeptidase peptidase domain-containing protein n=2 Tax=Dubosiella newyorkensis TaxID=1862672 RepID=A0A1U7NKT1_9FIRM|nr:hypothetical protein [Dubosiella newyorkensis]OLU45025.1 hypothetical protein BO225_09545 [Dubosiella newyorkensis]
MMLWSVIWLLLLLGTYMDLKTFYVPVKLILFLVLDWGLLVSLAPTSFFQEGFIPMLYGVSALLIYWIYPCMIGWVDVFLLFFFGTFFNLAQMHAMVCAACISGLMITFCFRKQKIPFVPFLMLGSILSIVMIPL